MSAASSVDMMQLSSRNPLPAEPEPIRLFSGRADNAAATWQQP